LLDANFALKIRGRNGNSTSDPSYRWDYIAVQVTYTELALGAGRLFVLSGPAMRRSSRW
jgi:hypothetical protein